jgi:hypothetical protein
LNVTAKAAPLDDARFRGAARAALEAAVIEAEAKIAPATKPAELPASTNEVFEMAALNPKSGSPEGVSPSETGATAVVERALSGRFTVGGAS